MNNIIKNKISSIYLLLFISFYIFSCKEDSLKVTYNIKGNRIIVDTIYSNHKIKTRTTYLRDTARKDGIYSEYNTDGNITLWKWFQYDSNNEKSIYPNAAVYYDKRGHFEKLAGNPFLNSGFNNHGEYVIEMINPPNVLFKIGITDSFNSKLISKQAYIPEKTDSTAWIWFEKGELLQTHSYILSYMVVDSNNKLLDKYLSPILIYP